MDGSDTTPANARMVAIGRTLRYQILILGGFITLIWVLELFDWLILNNALDSYGVEPRSPQGLVGIALMPLLHAGPGHVLANTLPFLVLGWIVTLRGIGEFFSVTLVVMVVSGLGVWLFGGANTVHIGASGLIFGYFGYLVLRAVFERSMASIAVAVIVVMLYSGLIWGILPVYFGVSWQAHLFGFLGGILAAYLLSRNRSRPAETLI